MKSSKQVILVGGGGHASVLVDILSTVNIELLGYVSLKDENIDLTYLGSDSYLESSLANDSLYLVNGIGSTHLPIHRKNIFEKYKRLGYNFLTLIHPTAIISTTAKIHEGAQVMAGSIIQPHCVIHENSIINTASSIDHHSIIEAHSHIAPGVTICGNVKIGKGSHVGPNTTIIQNAIITPETFIKANSLIKR
jgi:UDP-perosamine 4-acetyltransferase